MPDPVRLRPMALVGDPHPVTRSTPAKPSAPALAIVADDLTGAADIAGILRRARVGSRSSQAIRASRYAGARRGCRGRRSAHPHGALGAGRCACERRGRLAARGRAGLLAWKICSRSTPRRPATSGRSPMPCSSGRAFRRRSLPGVSGERPRRTRGALVRARRSARRVTDAQPPADPDARRGPGPPARPAGRRPGPDRAHRRREGRRGRDRRGGRCRCAIPHP